MWIHVDVTRDLCSVRVYGCDTHTHTWTHTHTQRVCTVMVVFFTVTVSPQRRDAVSYLGGHHNMEEVTAQISAQHTL
jgi:hypothetical protein